MNKELTNKVKKTIDAYLGFNSDELFKNGDALIFGGAVRDSIADMTINDIDIICGPLTSKKLHEFIQSKGFSFRDDLIKKNTSTLYKDICIINEPWTYLKGDKTIQIIRPIGKPHMTPIEYKEHLKYMVENVDISCCGVSYNGYEIREAHENAIMHCLCKIACMNPSGIMNVPGRSDIRMYKLQDRGWKFFNTEAEETELIRERNIEKIVD